MSTHRPPILDYPSSITSRESSFSSSHDAKLDQIQASHQAQTQDQVYSSSFASTTTEADSPREKDKRVENEVKQSRVATLRTKFSLRDIGEMKKEQEGAGLSGDDGLYSGTTTLQNSFGDGKDLGVSPQSVPASQILSGDALDLAAHLSMPDGESLENNRNAINAKKRTKLGNAMEDDANEQIDAMMIKASQAPTARKGQYLNSGQAEVVKTQASAQSLRAERAESTHEPFPRVQDNASQVEMSSPISSPFVYQPISEAQDTRKTISNTTTHGGPAPSPPDPTYNNTITLDQQLHSHVQALHHHLNSVVGRLTKTFESSNNWTMDQILRNVEVLSDTARLMNARSVGLGERVLGVQREVTELGERVDVLRGEVKGVEKRLIGVLREEVGRLRGEMGLGALPDSSRVMGIPVMTGARQLRPKEQDVSGGEHGNETNSLTEKDGMVQVIPGTPLPTTPVQKNETANPQRSGSSGRKNPARESSGSPEPRPTLDRSLSLDAVSENSQSTLQPLQKQKTNSTAPSEEGTKTPHKKSMFGFRRRRDTGDNQSLSSFSSSRFLRTPRRNKDKNNDKNNDKDKDKDKDKGKDKDKPSKKASSENLKKTVSTSDSTIAQPLTPPVPKVPANLAQPQPQPQPQHQRASHLQPPTNDQNMSPSAIHPALRNPRQQQIMREREQRLHHQQARLQQLNQNYRANQLPSSTSTAIIPQRSLRGSRSHQGFRSKVSAAPSASLFSPGGLVTRRSPSALSVRMDSDMGYQGLPHYQPIARYISASGSYLPEPPRFGGSGRGRFHGNDHGHGQGRGHGHGRPLGSQRVSSSSVVSRTGRGTGPIGSRHGSAEG